MSCCFRLMRGRSYLGVFVAFAVSGLSLYFFELTSKVSVFLNFVFLFLAGAANCGPDLVVSGSLATEVAKAANAESAVAGLVNGELTDFRLFLHIIPKCSDYYLLYSVCG